MGLHGTCHDKGGLSSSRSLRGPTGSAGLYCSKLKVTISGITVRYKKVGVPVTSIRVRPDPEGDGYEVRLAARLLGVLPVWTTRPVGGRRPGGPELPAVSD